MKRRIIILLTALSVLVIAALALIFTTFGNSDQIFADCKGEKDPQILDRCLSTAVTDEIKKNSGKKSITAILESADAEASASGSETAAVCHIAMHKTGREFALREKVTLANLEQYVPKSNSPDCPAGFTHGILSIITADVTDNKKMLAICSRQKTQAQQFACNHGIGHSFRRTFFRDETLGEVLNGCRTLGEAAQGDCAAGAYHDYMLAVKGYDDTYKPKNATKISKFCLSQPADFQKQCWFRLFIILGAPVDVTTPQDMLYVCGSLKGKQRSGCFAGLGAKVIGVNDLVNWCNSFKNQRDARSCISGGDLIAPDFLVEAAKNKKLSIEVYRRRTYIPLIAECSSMASERNRKECGYWLAYRSMREIPEAVPYKKAKIICSGAERIVADSCRSGIKEALSRVTL